MNDMAIQSTVEKIELKFPALLYHSLCGENTIGMFTSAFEGVVLKSNIVPVGSIIHDIKGYILFTGKLVLQNQIGDVE
jgi:hypothetical protein